MHEVDVDAAKDQLDRLLSLVERGEEVVIARSGHPVARLERIEGEASPRRLGTWRGVMTIADDFNDELDDCWQPFEPKVKGD